MYEPRGFRFDVVEVLTELLEGPLDLDGALEQGIDSRRVTGKTRDGRHVSILIKPVGPNNAAAFKRWVTLSPAEAEGLREGPRGWRGFVAMIGLLDDGSPWWVGVYDRDDLRAAAYGAETVPNKGGTGHFLRWEPGLLKPLIFKDLLEPEQAVDPEDLPERVVDGNDGAYWRDYVTHYSMPPVSEDNERVIPVAIYVRQREVKA